MKGVFITSTGTGIGKTYVIQQLLQYDLVNLRKFSAIKPIISGWPETESEIAKSDTGLLLQAQQIPCDLTHIHSISPWRFTAPLTPALAAEKEGREIKLEDLISFCRSQNEQAQKANKQLLLEGVGGVMAPVGKSYTVLDWMASLGCPALLIVGSYLGSLSHTLTAISALNLKKIPLLGVVINETPNSSVSCEETAYSLSPFIKSLPLWKLPTTQENADTSVISSLYSALLTTAMSILIQ